MFTLLQRIMSSGPYMPHGNCYLWTPGLVWLHVISDGLITLAYYSIPITLAWFVRRRRDFDFRGMFVCFAVFILACGTTHSLEVWNVWHGNYWVSGFVKAFTAVASIATAVLLVRLMPQAVALPSPAMLARTNCQLEAEVQTRRAAQTGLSELNAQLEDRVANRTKEFQAANAELERQILARAEVDQHVRWMASIPEQNPNPIVEFERRSGALRYANPAAFHTFADLECCGFGHRWLSGVRELVGGWTQEASRTTRHEAVFGDAFFLLNVTYDAATDGVRIYGSDISELKQAELVAARLAAIVEFSADAIMGKDLAGQITSWNAGAERMFDYTAQEMVGQPILCLIPPEGLEDENRILSRIKHGESVEHFETKRRRKDGQLIDVSVTVSPIKDTAGRIIGASKVARDITERSRIEEALQASEERYRTLFEHVDLLNAELEDRVVERTAQLEAANKELEAFSYSVSHDLRAPLRAVDGFSQAVVEDYSALLPADGQRQLQVIRESAQKMGQLVDDLLSFSRLSRQPLNFQTVEVGQLVREVLADLKAECLRRNVEITLGDLPPCQGDRALLQRVWVNLLSNALKYSGKREHPTVEIGCRQQDGQSVYFVRDNGTGFDMRYAGKLFGVFHRLHLAEDYEGTGVGLAIVQRVVQRHGGRVWAQAEVDRGATFFFTLAGDIKT